MSERPELIRPDDASIEAAMIRAQDALAAVLHAIGDGAHTLSLAVYRTDGAHLWRETDVLIASDPVRLATLDQDSYATLRMLLVFALEGSTVTDAVLIATTAAEPRPRACGWTARRGWLQPMGTSVLQSAVTPCPGSSAVDREVYPAPALVRRSDLDDRRSHG
ncbi:hypothetical protein ACFU96_44270 [Streptomyces sp. NPDC057620]|uniref:hypothetical protein n=1 Tax=Streptomyces sp. NPDC057620 TaxID=3346185 RepID=UPI0036CC67D9